MNMISRTSSRFIVISDPNDRKLNADVHEDICNTCRPLAMVVFLLRSTLANLESGLHEILRYHSTMASADICQTNAWKARSNHSTGDWSATRECRILGGIIIRCRGWTRKVSEPSCTVPVPLMMTQKDQWSMAQIRGITTRIWWPFWGTKVLKAPLYRV